MSLNIGDDERARFLADAHTAILTTLRRDGRPISLPIWFVVVRDELFMQTPRGSAKVRRVQRDPRGALLVERGEHWIDLAAIHLDVRISVVDEPEVIAAVESAFEDKYADHRLSPDEMPRAVQRAYADQVVLRLEPVGRPLSWDNTKIRLPGS